MTATGGFTPLQPKGIRLVISDVDGTLVHTDKSLSQVNINAVHALQNAGIVVTLISARQPAGMTDLIVALGIKAPLGAFNGGTLFSPDGKVISRTGLDRDLVKTLLALSKAPSIETWLFSEGKWYAPSERNPHIAREILSAGVEPTIIEDYANLADGVDKLMFVSDDPTALGQLKAEAERVSLGRATIGLSQDYFLDVTSVDANKGQGVEALAKAIGIPLSQVAVIGDMPNDLPMFARAGLSIAMGQAPDHVRQAADHVTGAADEDGFAQAMADHILPVVAGAAS